MVKKEADISFSAEPWLHASKLIPDTDADIGSGWSYGMQLLGAGESSLPALHLSLRGSGLIAAVGPDMALVHAYLQALAGERPLLAGQVTLLATPLAELTMAERQLLRCECGYLLQDTPLMSILTAFANVVVPAIYHGMNREQAAERAQEQLARVGFVGDQHALPAYLTTEQCQQVALARALVLNPRCLFIEGAHGGFGIEQFPALVNCLQHYAEAHSVVLATNNRPFLQQHEGGVLFIGNQHAAYYSSWQALQASAEQQVQHYLAGEMNGVY